jgi:hypothetical protein
VPPAPLARLIGGDLVLRLDPDLLADKGLHAGRRLGQVIEERAEEAHGAELYGNAEAHVVAAPGADEGLVGIVEVEVAREMIGRWLAREAATGAAARR